MTTPQILTGDAAVKEADALAPVNRRVSPQRLSLLSEAMDIMYAAFSGDERSALDLRDLLQGKHVSGVSEAMSTSDFPKLFGDVLDRELLAQYEQINPIWPMFARRTVVRDFRPKKWLDLLGGRAILEGVGQGAEYPAGALTEGDYSLTVSKYGARLPLYWEMFVNDDLDAFRDAPERLAQAARDTEDYLATGLVASATGPTAFFSGNGGVGTVPLNTDNLSAALTAIATRKDSEGRPIQVSAYVLMVPPALEVMANNILNATLIRLKSTNQDVEVTNWLRGKVSIVVNPWLPIIDTSGTTATTWYLLPAPATARPAVVMGFLRGHEVPDLRVRADAGQRVGGGNVPAEEGSFDTDDIQYRVRHVSGGTTLDPIAAYASKGA